MERKRYKRAILLVCSYSLSITSCSSYQKSKRCLNRCVYFSNHYDERPKNRQKLPALQSTYGNSGLGINKGPFVLTVLSCRSLCCTHFWGLAPSHMQSFPSLLVCGIPGDKVALPDLVSSWPETDRQQENVHYICLKTSCRRSSFTKSSE